MKIGSKTNQVSEASGALRGTDVGFPEILTFWRTLPADAFSAPRRAEVIAGVASIASTMDEWRRAVGGDATAAVALALRTETPDRIDLRIDVVMTVLLRCAFEDAGAALVLSRKLSVMPMDAGVRGRLAASWLVHNHRRARRRSRPLRSISSRLLEGVWT